MSPVIRLEGVSRVFETRDVFTHAVQNVSIGIEPSEFVSIFGKSGSGKSTLLHLMGLLDTPSTGEVYLEGLPTRGLSPKYRALLRAKRIGFVFQSFNLIGEMTVTENVLLPLTFARAPGGKNVHRARVAEALDLVGLGHRANHYPAELSGGQQQRVAIARAIATNPPIVLADEPTGNLDSATGREVVKLLQSLREQGTTVVVITHDEALAKSADRIVTMHDGAIIA